MIQSYSKNVNVAAGSPVPFNTNYIDKGCADRQVTSTDFKLLKCGVYEVNVDASVATQDTSGNVALQLFKDGSPFPPAFTQAQSAADADVESLSFSTFVQVKDSDSCRCCDSATTLQLQNVGVAATFSQVNITIKKLC